MRASGTMPTVATFTCIVSALARTGQMTKVSCQPESGGGEKLTSLNPCSKVKSSTCSGLELVQRDSNSPHPPLRMFP